MNRAYVETTVLTDALLKPGPRARAARSAINSYHESLLPVYAIKEFKAGPLSHYVWLHGKLVTTKSWAQTVSQLRKSSMSPFQLRRISTALEALEAVTQKHLKLTSTDLVTKHGALATLDAILCDRYRLSLRLIIMRAWKKRRQLCTVVVDELSCYAEEEIVEERGLIELGEIKCQPKDECHLAAELRKYPQLLDAMKAVVDAEPTKNENVKRSQALRDLVRLPNQKLTPKQCRYLGDAIFAFFCPINATILTTNIKDLLPLAQALGKTAATP